MTMGLDSRQGVYVLAGGGVEHPDLVVYRRVAHRYLLMTFSENTVSSVVCSFPHILDVIPIGSRFIGGVSELPLLETLEATERAWLNAVYHQLAAR